MFDVYVLKSVVNNWFYVGLSQDKTIRLDQHNKGKVRSTRKFKPFIIIYSKKFTSRLEARDFEKFLKIRFNKEKLLKKLDYI